jgi:hypothetical protein
MTIQHLLTLAIEAIFYCFAAFMALDFFLRYIAPFSVPPLPSNIKKPKSQSLDELGDDGIYNFGLALALSDLE